MNPTIPIDRDVTPTSREKYHITTKLFLYNRRVIRVISSGKAILNTIY